MPLSDSLFLTRPPPINRDSYPLLPRDGTSCVYRPVAIVSLSLRLCAPRRAAASIGGRSAVVFCSRVTSSSDVGRRASGVGLKRTAGVPRSARGTRGCSLGVWGARWLRGGLAGWCGVLAGCVSCVRYAQGLTELCWFPRCANDFGAHLVLIPAHSVSTRGEQSCQPPVTAVSDLFHRLPPSSSTVTTLRVSRSSTSSTISTGVHNPHFPHPHVRQCSAGWRTSMRTWPFLLKVGPKEHGRSIGTPLECLLWGDPPPGEHFMTMHQCMCEAGMTAYCPTTTTTTSRPPTSEDPHSFIHRRQPLDPPEPEVDDDVSWWPGLTSEGGMIWLGILSVLVFVICAVFLTKCGDDEVEVGQAVTNRRRRSSGR